MKQPENTFKQALAKGNAQIGLWLGLANPYCAELLAGSGYDWLVVDGEHAPNDIRSILAQLQALAPYPVQPVVRPPWKDIVQIKQILDIGAQTLLIPMVETPEEAIEMVAAIRYPPSGIRGVGSGMARASRWNRVQEYLHKAEQDICLLLQVETCKGLDNLDAILTVDHIDGIFIGPSDLSATLGHLGNPEHAEVQQAIESSIAKIIASGKAAGILSENETLAHRYLDLGATFVAVGVDTSLLANSSEALLKKFKRSGQDEESKQTELSVY